MSFIDVQRWLEVEHQTSITAQSIGRHAKDHVGIRSTLGRRPASADFLENVRDAAADGLASGELAVTLKDGIAAQKALDARDARDKDRDWQMRLVLALTGNVPALPAIDPELEVIEGTFRPLLTAGD